MARMNKSGPLRAARSSSREKQPGAVTFAEAGEHKDTSSCEACRWGEGERTAHTSRFYAFLLCRATSVRKSDAPFFFERSVSQPYNMLQRFELQ